MPNRLNATPDNADTAVRGTSRYSGACNVCGRPYTATKRTAEFCSVKCRQAFNRRRRDRGADLYDLYMAFRHNRAIATAYKVQTMMNRMAMHWKAEDDRERGGRRSYHAPKVVLARHPYLEAVATDIRRKTR